MNLHRTAEVPEWETVPRADWNTWQRIAHETDGIVTPGNVVTMAGFGLVSWGLIDIMRGHVGRGVFKVGLGRVLDVFDGRTADKTKTKSPKGEALDVAVDKTEAATALPVIIGKGIVPAGVAAVLAIPEVGKGWGTALAKAKDNEIHPSKEGKLSTLAQWNSIGFFGLAKVSKNRGHNVLSKGLETTAYVSAAVSTYLGAKAFLGYMKDALQPTQSDITSS